MVRLEVLWELGGVAVVLGLSAIESKQSTGGQGGKKERDVLGCGEGKTKGALPERDFSAPTQCTHRRAPRFVQHCRVGRRACRVGYQIFPYVASQR